MTDAEKIAALIAMLKNVTFIAETTAHLRGLEREILPATDAARELIALIEGSQDDALLKELSEEVK